mgnify:CR=1 FL=1|tara:strand:- start:10524 stop:12467 length:1944 start_codon:yes stop_codon:yes gene_type:complete
MCGILSIICLKNPENDILKLTNDLVQKLNHRGPNAKGTWVSQDRKISLGHTRLSIQDLSNNGSQPMISKSTDSIISYNGEIYNHFDLRLELEEYKNIEWKGRSDTETLLECVEFWGLPKTLNKVRGMFSFIYFDRKNNKVCIARDRFGEKPLYYGIVNNYLIIGSELKVFKNFPNFNNQISQYALDQLMRKSYIPSPQSIYKDIYKLNISSFIEIKLNNLESINFSNLKQTRWWKFNKTVEENNTYKFHNFNLAKTTLENTLQETINMLRISDVPLGVFLSSGTDSSLVASILQSQTKEKINTFTIGFKDDNFNEAVQAKEISKIIGSNHIEEYIDSSTAQDIIPQLSNIYDEPFADSSQIPTYFVSKLAKEKVTVALSGDGGDEFFGGYNRYIWSPKIINIFNKLPYRARKLLGHLILFSDKNNFKISDIFIEKILKLSNFNDKLSKLARKLLEYEDLNEFLLKPVDEWHDNKDLVIKLEEDKKFNLEFPNTLMKNTDKLMFLDSQTYLPDDILCKVDRASMYNSLEVRCPFLDYEIINISQKIPTKMKIRNSRGKIILKEILKNYLPNKLVEQPKKGFAVPIGEWIKNPLRDWAEELLSEKKLKEEGIINHKLIRSTWEIHKNTNIDHSSKLWPFLIFMSWKENT